MNIKPQDFYTADSETKLVLWEIALLTANRHHMGMEWRIKNELDKRAACGGLNEEYTLAHADLRNKLMLESDINRRRIAAKRGLYYSAVLDKFVSIPE